MEQSLVSQATKKTLAVVNNTFYTIVIMWYDVVQMCVMLNPVLIFI